ncbi:MAG: translocation/assembly module TamB domain-containing protein [Bacteroidales bacterium]|nr:translocation/assembly module TamB domain-containing protein [Bacteroidales bacterium]
MRSTVGKFLSAELNKLSAKVVPGVELNFDVQSYDDYETGEAQGRTQVDIGAKKQLFNDRLTVQVGGVVDVEGERAKQNSLSNITTDVDVEYKLTGDGRYRLKGFTHNQYEGAIEGQLVETGVGVAYVRDFNRWKQFFRAPRKKRDLSKPKAMKNKFWRNTLCSYSAFLWLHVAEQSICRKEKNSIPVHLSK